MNPPNQVVPSFSQVFLTANQSIGASSEVVLFDIVETDGSNSSIYNSTTGQFTAPVSGWYRVRAQLQSSTALTGITIVKNGDTNFPIIGRVPVDTNAELEVLTQLGLGETVQIQAQGVADVLALSGLSPDTRASTALFILTKRFDDTKTF